MVPLLQRVTFFKHQKSNQKGSPQAFGPSLGLGVPSLRHPSGDIASGLLRCTSSRCVRLRRTALRAHSPDECLHSAFRRGGWIKSKSKSKIKSARRANARPCGLVVWWALTVGASLLAKAADLTMIFAAVPISLWELACQRRRPHRPRLLAGVLMSLVGASLLAMAVLRSA